MRNPHVAIFTIPAPVHVNPTLSIVSIFIRRGYRVTYVTSSRHAETLESLGAEVLRCPRFEFPLDQRNGDASMPIDRQYATTLTDLASRSLELVSPIYKRDPPDCVIFDTHSYAGLLLAERLGVPSVRVTSHLITDEEATFKNEKLDAFFLQNGINRMSPLLNRDGLTVHLFANELQVGHCPVDQMHFYAARCAAERPCGIYREKVSAQDRDISLVSCSTFYVQGAQYYSMCIDALSQLERRGVLALPAQVDAASLGSITPNCMVVKGTPLLALMPHANLLIFQGGMATTMEAIYHGLPMVVLTQGHAQLEAYADNIQKHHLGIHLRRTDTTVESIKRAIRHVTDDVKIRESVISMGSLVRNSPGSEDVVNLIEDLLGSAPKTRQRFKSSTLRSD